MSSFPATNTYYHTLGVARNADQRTIKKQFRRLAKQYHPDVNHTSEANRIFREVYEAYEILSDPQKRDIYDYLLQRQELLRKRREAEEDYGKESRTYQRHRRHAAAEAYRHAKMNYEEFNDSLSGKIEFHMQQLVGLGLITFLFFIGGASLFYAYKFFISDFNGSKVAAYFCFAIGLALIYGVKKTLPSLLGIWFKWFKHNAQHKSDNQKD